MLYSQKLLLPPQVGCAARFLPRSSTLLSSRVPVPGQREVRTGGVTFLCCRNIKPLGFPLAFWQCSKSFKIPTCSEALSSYDFTWGMDLRKTETRFLLSSERQFLLFYDFMYF